MKIVVTGGRGKAGRWIVRELTSSANGRQAHDVLVFDRTPHAKDSGVRHLTGDILDLGQVFEALAGSDAVIHLAGVPSNGIVSEELTVRTNVMGTFNVHEAALRLGIKHVVTMGSEAALGWSPTGWVREVPPDYLPIDENHPLRPQDAYGTSKVAAEVIARSFVDRAGLNCLVLRPPRIFSPDELEALRASDGIKPTRFGLFHYMDTRDLAEVCRLAVERPLTGFNALLVGSGESLLREPLCTAFPRLMPAIGNKAAGLVDGVGAVSIDKARTLFKWMPKHSWRRASSS